MGFDHVLLENVQFPSAQNGKQDFGSTGGRDRSAQLAADIAAWDARFEGSVTLWYGYSLGQVTDGASTVAPRRHWASGTSWSKSPQSRPWTTPPATS